MGTRPQNCSPVLFQAELGAKLLDRSERRPALGAHKSRAGPEFVYVTIVRSIGLQQRVLVRF